MKLRPALRLARIPNVFTAFANVIAGVALARGGALRVEDLTLVGASGALYIAGMVLNDYFDREVDAKERPSRPIPAGEISARSAAVLGMGLIVVGLALAATRGALPLAVAGTLVLFIVLYDAWLKATPLGPLAMGACRALNILLGMSVQPWPAPPLWVAPVSAGIFTLLITRLSRFEVFGTAPARLRSTIWSFAVLAALWTGGLVWVQQAAAPANPLAALALALLVVFAIVRGRRLFSPLLREVTPALLGRAIGGGILLMPALDAACVAASGAPLMSAIVLGCTLPAYALKRWYYLT